MPIFIMKLINKVSFENENKLILVISFSIFPKEAVQYGRISIFYNEFISNRKRLHCSSPRNAKCNF